MKGKKCLGCGCEIENIDGYNYCDYCWNLKLKGFKDLGIFRVYFFWIN